MGVLCNYLQDETDKKCVKCRDSVHSISCSQLVGDEVYICLQCDLPVEKRLAKCVVCNEEIQADCKCKFAGLSYMFSTMLILRTNSSSLNTERN